MKKSLDRARKLLPDFLYRVAQFLEIIISGILILAIVLSMRMVLTGLLELQNSSESGALQEFLALIFTVVIGIEFLKMLCRHSVRSVMEVLLFAIARQMVVEHTTPLENLLMVAAIAILFLIRKYLFIPEVDSHHSWLERTAAADSLMAEHRELAEARENQA